MANYIRKFILSISILILANCHETHVSKANILTVEQDDVAHAMYYAGKIEPVVLETVVNPIKSQLDQINVKYGDYVDEGQTIYETMADTADGSFIDIIVDYLRARDDLKSSEQKLKSDSELLSLGIIARSEYDESKRNHDLNNIVFIKSDEKLRNLASIIGIDFSEFNNIDLSNTTAVSNLINAHRHFTITAKSSGLFLKNNSKEADVIAPGMVIDKGRVIGYIAAEDKVLVKISITEVDINKIKQGQKVNVTGDGFPGLTLQGEVKNISLYKIDDATSSSTKYPVEILIPNLNKYDKKIVFGMSTKAEILQQAERSIVLPLKSIHNDANKSYVNKIDYSNHIINSEVKLGRTTIEGIEVLSGVSNGDKVLISD